MPNRWRELQQLSNKFLISGRKTQRDLLNDTSCESENRAFYKQRRRNATWAGHSRGRRKRWRPYGIEEDSVKGLDAV